MREKFPEFSRLFQSHKPTFPQVIATESKCNNDLHQESFHVNSSNITGHHHTLTTLTTPGDSNDPIYLVNSCFTRIFERQTKTTLFVVIFPRGCTEFPEFSMFREIPECSRFVATLIMPLAAQGHNKNNNCQTCS